MIEILHLIERKQEFIFDENSSFKYYNFINMN